MKKETAAKKKKDDSKGFKDFYKSYSTKEARAGHKEDMSKKHRKAEARGMKKAMTKKKS